MGDPLPEMAARLVDVGYPAALAPGERGAGWVVFRNEGSRTWEAGDLWFEATSTWEGAPSSLHDDENWPAYGVVAVLDQTVRSGEEVMMDLPLKSPVAADGELREQFHLVDRKGWALRCPAVKFDVAVITRKPVEPVDDGSPAQEGGEAKTTDASATAGCACALSPSGGDASAWFWLVGLAWVVRGRANAKEQQRRRQ
jgi:MYXO-CTERM domain-containing protein